MMVKNEKQFEVKGLKTREGVRRRVEKIVATIPEMDRVQFRWSMAVKEDGTFYAIAFNWPNYMLAPLCQAGICVV